MKFSSLLLAVAAPCIGALDIKGFWLIDAETNSEIKQIGAGDVLDLASLPSKLSIEAKASEDTQSVKMDFDDAIRIDNHAPYSVAGDSRAVYRPIQSVDLLPMKHSISATAFSEDNAQGNTSPTVSIAFNIIDSRLEKPDLFSVSKFYLYDADSDEILFEMEDGMEIDLVDLPTLNVTIVAETTPSVVGSVRMRDVSPVKTFARTEQLAPYTLTGERNGDFFPMDLRIGPHDLTAIPYSERSLTGTQGEMLRISYMVKASVKVTGFTLVDAGTDSEIGPLSEGDSLDLAKLPASLNIKVETNLEKIVKSIEIQFDGKDFVENWAPYSVGRDIKGDYDHLNLLPMPYTLTATPFVEKMAAGDAGLSKTISFSVVNTDYVPSDVFSVEKFVLIDSNTDQPIFDIIDGMTISIEEVGINLNVEVKTQPEQIGSVLITHPWGHRLENVYPYALFGDQNGDFSGRKLNVGEYFLEATPYSERNNIGYTGHEKSVSFTVVKAFSCLGDAFRVGLPANGCSYHALLEGIAAEIQKVSCKHGAELELELLTGKSDLDSIEREVNEFCEQLWVEKSASFLDHDLIANDEANTVFTKAFYDGGTDWNDFKQRDKPRISEVYEQVTGSGLGISWPGEKEIMKNFQECGINAVMCCYVGAVADNTDVCYNDMRLSQSSNHVRNGFALFEDGAEGSAHCHGFAWDEDINSLDSVYRGNMLFYLSMYTKFFQQGFTEPVPGAPICGCVEQMPVVTRADCSKIIVNHPSVFWYDENGWWVDVDASASEISFGQCNGEVRNDLTSYYAKLVSEGKATTRNQSRLANHLVGNSSCDATEFLAHRGWKKVA